MTKQELQRLATKTVEIQDYSLIKGRSRGFVEGGRVRCERSSVAQGEREVPPSLALPVNKTSTCTLTPFPVSAFHGMKLKANLLPAQSEPLAACVFVEWSALSQTRRLRVRSNSKVVADGHLVTSSFGK